MASVSGVLCPMLFADDTYGFFLNGRDANQLVTIMNGEFLKIVSWLDCNQFSLNVSKTHFILFISQRMCKPALSEPLIIKKRIHKTGL